MSTKTILITGCSPGGIGEALALVFARKGHRVFATLRDTGKAKDSGLSNPKIDILPLDVTSEESVREAARKVQSLLGPSGKLDILINNAGFGYTGPLLDVKLDVAKKLYDVNVWGLLMCTQVFADMLISAKGTIVNISSVGGLVNQPYGGLYHSSKAAVTMLSEILRVEMEPLGVRVVTAMLGNISSNFHGNDKWEGLPESSYYKCIESNVADYAANKQAPKQEPVEKFAENFVGDILGGAKGQVYRGNFAQITRFMFYHFPAGMLDGMLENGSGFDVLRKQTSSQTKKDL